MGQASSFRHCTHKVSKSEGKEGRERASTVASLFAKEPFPGHSPRLLAGEWGRARGRQGRGRGHVNKSNVRKEEKESGDRAREKGVGAQACRADSPTCRSAFQQRSWPWNLWAGRSRQSRTAWSPRESWPGCWRAWHLCGRYKCKFTFPVSLHTQHLTFDTDNFGRHQEIVTKQTERTTSILNRFTLTPVYYSEYDNTLIFLRVLNKPPPFFLK